MKMERKKESRRLLAMLLTGVLLIGCLPLQSVFAQETLPSGYGLSNPTTDSEDVVTWDCVYFGNYWQNDTNGDGKADRNDKKEPIKWRVLSVDGEDAFLLADKGLDCQPYNSITGDVTWETCTIRSWLNGYGADKNDCGMDYTKDNFLNNAFNTSEQTAIFEWEIANRDNTDYNTYGGNNTTDRVYLLSLDETGNVNYGFDADFNKKAASRKLKISEYAKTFSVYMDTNSNGCWWLRSPGRDNNYASNTHFTGVVVLSGDYVNITNRAVRPALHINLSENSCWTNAGKVTSDGEEIPPVTPEPKPTEIPAVTEEPVMTQKPTQILGETEPPAQSPSATQTVPPAESPTATEKTEKTPEPIQTPSVVSTESPNPTKNPETTTEPEQTPTPAPTRQPSPSPTGTPAPTKSPAPDQNLSDIMGGLGVSEETAVKIQKTAEELNVAKDTILVTEQTILSQKTDEDIKGSYFARIQARAPQITQKNIKLSWNKVKVADGYEIYGNRCNTKNWIYEYKRMKTITNPNKKSFIDRKCKKGTYYKYIVRAYKIIDGKKVTIAASKTIHVTTTGGKNGNAKSVKVNKKKVSLKTGNNLKLRAWEIKKDKPLRHHREVSFESSDPGVATISRKGRIKAKKKGNCTIYAYAQNGKYRKIKVKVK